MTNKCVIKVTEVGQRDRQKRSVHAVASLNDTYKKSHKTCRLVESRVFYSPFFDTSH